VGEVNTLQTSDGLVSTNEIDPVRLTQRGQVQGPPGREDTGTLFSGVVSQIFDETSLQLVRSERYDTTEGVQGVTHYRHDGRGYCDTVRMNAGT
jgi:hypothetical protein